MPLSNTAERMWYYLCNDLAQLREDAVAVAEFSYQLRLDPADAMEGAQELVEAGWLVALHPQIPLRLQQYRVTEKGAQHGG